MFLRARVRNRNKILPFEMMARAFGYITFWELMTKKGFSFGRLNSRSARDKSRYNRKTYHAKQ